MAWPDEVTAFRTETLTSKQPGLSGAGWIGAYPQEGLTLADGTPADTVMEQLVALMERERTVPTATETQQGAVEHATEAEVQAGTAGNLVATVARLKAELDRREAQEAWITPSLTDGWVALGTPYDTAQYYKDRLGRVHLRGVVKNGTVGSGATIFTLPAGYRPASQEIFSPSVGGSSPGRVDVATGGRVVPIAGANAHFSLSGISFRAA